MNTVDFGFGGLPTRVLIGNDQEWSARSLESVLGPLGCTITRAFTGQQVLDAARTVSPHLVLLDTQLPDIHGFDVCRRLRQPELLGATTPIVMTTSGPSGRTQRLEALQAGAWDFLAEPVDVELLLPRLATYVLARRALTPTPLDAAAHG